MATFTREEFADQERIERGFDRFHFTTVPFGLDPGFGSLKKAIQTRDNLYGTETPARFSILDGVGVVSQNPTSTRATEMLEQLVEGESVSLQDTSVGSILDLLVAKSQEPQAKGDATIYFLSSDRNKILGVVNLREGNLTLTYGDLRYSYLGDWGTKSAQNILGLPVDSLDTDSNGRSRDALYRIEYMLKSIKAQQTTEESYSRSAEDSRWNVELVVDGGVFHDEILAQLGDSSREHTLSDPKARELCLMMTQEWIEPAFNFSDNVPHYAVLNQLAGTDRVVEGNCVEQSIAAAINFHGGIDGQMVNPRFRVLPSSRALQSPEPRFHLDDIDPLSDQTMSRRLFGEAGSILGDYSLEEQEIGEIGATVQVPGHQFFVVKEGDQLNVYDTAMRFCGPGDLYMNFLEMRGLSTALKSVSHFQSIDPLKAKFFDLIRTPYRNEDVYKRTKEIFSELVPSDRSIDRLFSAWNHALGERPDLIADAINVQHAYTTPQTQGQAGLINTVSSLTIDEMLLSQENGFIAYESVLENSNTTTHKIAFKVGDDIFISAGRGGSAFKAEEGKVYGDVSYLEMRVVSFGGSNPELMKSIFDRGVSHHLDMRSVESQTPNVPTL